MLVKGTKRNQVKEKDIKKIENNIEWQKRRRPKKNAGKK